MLAVCSDIVEAATAAVPEPSITKRVASVFRGFARPLMSVGGSTVGVGGVSTMTDQHFDKYEAQTQYKHQIFKDYFGPWCAILGTANRKLYYVDGFCGPGTYRDAQGQTHDGSPVIALRIADQNSARAATECLFTDRAHQLMR